MAGCNYGLDGSYIVASNTAVFGCNYAVVYTKIADLNNCHVYANYFAFRKRFR